MCYAQIAAAGVQAFGAKKQAEGQALSLEHQADLDDYNAELALIDAEDAKVRGKKEVKQIQKKGEQFKGTQIAARGASGVDVGSGTSFDIISDTERGIASDSLTARINYEKESESHVQRSAMLKYQGEMNRYSAEKAKTAGAFAAGGTFASGAASAYQGYQQGNYQRSQ